MPTWDSLEQDFLALTPQAGAHHLNYRWGVDGESFELVGEDAALLAKFSALAESAGGKLEQIPRTELPIEVTRQRDAASRWYEVLRLQAPQFKPGESQVHRSANGLPRGAVHAGTLPDPILASARLAHELRRFDAGASGDAIVARASAGIAKVPSIADRRDWRVSWTPVVFIAVGILAALAAILPYIGRQRVTTELQPPRRSSAASSATASAPANADESVIEIQQLPGVSSTHGVE